LRKSQLQANPGGSEQGIEDSGAAKDIRMAGFADSKVAGLDVGLELQSWTRPSGVVVVGGRTLLCFMGGSLSRQPLAYFFQLLCDSRACSFNLSAAIGNANRLQFRNHFNQRPQQTEVAAGRPIDGALDDGLFPAHAVALTLFLDRDRALKLVLDQLGQRHLCLGPAARIAGLTFLESAVLGRTTVADL
jgi:hypothetical protein